jgi:hypothetical protein
MEILILITVFLVAVAGGYLLCYKIGTKVHKYKFKPVMVYPVSLDREARAERQRTGQFHRPQGRVM